MFWLSAEQLLTHVLALLSALPTHGEAAAQGATPPSVMGECIAAACAHLCQGGNKVMEIPIVRVRNC